MARAALGCSQGLEQLAGEPLAALTQPWFSQLLACGGCGHPNGRVLSAELTDMWTLVADLRGEGHVVSPPPVPRVSLLLGCREVLRGTVPCVTWVGAQT